MEMETSAFAMLASNHNIILTLNGQYVRWFPNRGAPGHLNNTFRDMYTVPRDKSNQIIKCATTFSMFTYETKFVMMIIHV
jgi:hypothetical protein